MKAKKKKKQKKKHLHNVEHVVQLTFRNMLIVFKHKRYNANFEFSSQWILTKNLNLIFSAVLWGWGSEH